MNKNYMDIFMSFLIFFFWLLNVSGNSYLGISSSFFFRMPWYITLVYNQIDYPILLFYVLTYVQSLSQKSFIFLLIKLNSMFICIVAF